MMEKKDILKLEVIKNKLDKAVSSIGDYPFHNALGIYIGHALEGVRTNGWQKLNSWPEINVEFQSVLRSHERVKKGLPAIVKLIGEFQEELNRYIICPVCEGKHGTESNSGGFSRSTWEDCENCKGHGVILKQ